MKHTLLTLAFLAILSVIGKAQNADTIIRSIQPINMVIPATSKSFQAIRFPGYLFPYFSKIEDVDVYLDIEHEAVNDLQITVYSPLNRKATVITVNSCIGQPTQFPGNIKVTLDDQAYNVNVYNSTGQKVGATYTCTSADPSVGVFNKGNMQPQGDELQIFNAENWVFGGECGKSVPFSATPLDIEAAFNRISNFSVQQFLLKGGFLPGDRLLLTYSSAKGGVLGGLQVNQTYLFQVINNNTIEFLTITGSDITSVPPGSTHEFVFQRDWLVVVEDYKVGGGGKINEIALKLAIVEEPCAPQKVDDMENITSDPPAEIRDGGDNSQLTLYPNPFTDHLYMDWMGDDTDGLLTIYRIDGQLVFGPAALVAIKDLSTVDWSAGMYMAEWKGGADTKRTLLVKQ
jgi:hypothetical protein